MNDSLTVTRTVDAPAAALFDLLATPARHAEFDGSGFIRRVEEPGRVGAVGDVFTMEMANERLGTYRMRNTVVTYEPGRAIGWAPALYPRDGYREYFGDMRASGHTYTWYLEPAGDGRTAVTQVYDWSGVTDERYRTFFPRLRADQLTDSIDRAAAAAR